MTTALEGASGQRHAPSALYSRERPGTHFTGGWVVACRGNTKFWLENLKRGDYLGELCVDQRVTQKVYFCRASEHRSCQGSGGYRFFMW